CATSRTGVILDGYW
nr:immunoglobulin heavy chain junction region [Macaca mulatta]MOW77636.1 immunoglobulin heavy chain junction region [Macaca mulatta]MOW77929.1 immunoglobulin heavy chain junction region [Macaca mulatta]MOW78317.1 immunoglobulin heavy chain junction region [Macaca mulatta]MOW78995.1 immunoglobulin heavy chain junction region [Macaca mulatta]